MHHAGRGGLPKRILTNTIVFDARLRSASKGVAGAGFSGSGNGVYRVKRENQRANGGWY